MVTAVGAAVSGASVDDVVAAADGSGDAGGLVFLLVFFFFPRLLNVVLMFLFRLKETAWAFIL